MRGLAPLWKCQTMSRLSTPTAPSGHNLIFPVTVFYLVQESLGFSCRQQPEPRCGSEQHRRPLPLQTGDGVPGHLQHRPHRLCSLWKHTTAVTATARGRSYTQASTIKTSSSSSSVGVFMPTGSYNKHIQLVSTVRTWIHLYNSVWYEMELLFHKKLLEMPFLLNQSPCRLNINNPIHAHVSHFCACQPCQVWAGFLFSA